MTDLELKPRLRFKGFTEAWEQRKLGDEATELLAGGDIDKAKSSENGKYPIYANALTNEGIVGYYNDFFRVKAPAVTITGRGEIGYAIARNVDFTPVVRLISIKTKHNNSFLANAINQLKVVSESTGVPQLTVPQVEKYEIKFPVEIKEEIQIAKLFNGLDSLITLHQRKCEKLKSMKVALLEKMFPDENEKTPKIRFKGFIEAWEQRKLKELCTYESSNITSQDISSIGKYELFDANGSIGRTDKCAIRKEYISIIKDGAGVGRIKKLPKNSAILGTMGAIKAEYCEYNFLFSLLEKANIGASFSGSTIPHIYFKDYGENNYFVPSALEQKSIGELFNNLDNLITLHQRKCEKLKNLKKSLLERMFI